jgi:hypothetical protein
VASHSSSLGKIDTPTFLVWEHRKNSYYPSLQWDTIKQEKVIPSFESKGCGKREKVNYFRDVLFI